MVRPIEHATWFWLFAAILQCQKRLSSASFPATAAAHWILYSMSSSNSVPRLALTWNEASMFCKSLGGHLPVLNTKCKMNGFFSTATKWKTQNAVNDVWTGLYTPKPINYPDTWEADCTLHPDGLDFWAAGEPDELGSALCARYALSYGLRTRSCTVKFDTVCEFPKGNCLKVSWNGSLTAVTTLQTVDLNATVLEECWEKCMNYGPTATGEECVGAQYDARLQKCTGYLGDAFLAIPDPLPNIMGSLRAMVKVCFNADTSDCYTQYSYVNSSNIPRPAGDPCNNSKFSPVIPTPTKASCLETSTTRSTQQQQLDQSTARATTEGSSARSWIGSRQTTSEFVTRATAESNPEASSLPPVTTSNPLNEVYSSSQTDRTLSPQTPDTHSISLDDTPTAGYKRPSSSDNENAANTTALSSNTTTFSLDVAQNGSSIDVTSPITASPPVLCACMKSRLNLSAPQHSSIVHHNTTSRYRRGRQSEWGSPSVVSSAGSTLFLAVTGLVTVLFLACDVHHLINRFEKTGGRTDQTTEL